MPYETKWYIEGQVIYGRLWGEQTFEELKESNENIIAHLDTSNGRLVHAILNDEALEKLPVSVLQVQKILTYSKHPHLGWVILIGDQEKSVKDAAVDFGISLLARLTRARYIRFKTFAEAVEHLRKVDATIDWDAVDPSMQAVQAQLAND